MRFVLPPLHRPRHPLLRVLSALLGVAVLGALLVFGLLALAVFAVVGGGLLLWRRWAQSRTPAAAPGPHAPPHTPDVLEGEFVVVRQGRQVTQ
jgi:hypothetical protein